MKLVPTLLLASASFFLSTAAAPTTTKTTSAAAKTSAAAQPTGTGAIGTNCNIVANHTVVAGDTVSAIATAAKVTVDQVTFVNPQISNIRRINPGDVIHIPNSKCVAPAAAPLAEPTATCSNGTATTYTVVAGDTLTIIAKEKLGITLPALQAANPQITDPNKIKVGDLLNIPLCKNQGTTPATGSGGKNSTTKSVQMPTRGETVFELEARKQAV
ncbi:hypothetical protein BP5796_10734 [Coleophoma crateriformis]|uniref:LysM domain-containing protein n=1 Tax=Coleophoma crateriformis TaxID=565419 RepID=A0A3D8QR02_9HELO|nr:hypothetical protein BP5796_10734 [Coleophoma crateriformis]